MDVRTIRWPDDLDAILAHIERVHGLADRVLAEATYGLTPGFNPHDCFVIEADGGTIAEGGVNAVNAGGGTIAAHAMLIPRQIQIGRSRLPTAEISMLGVLPDYAGEGYDVLLMDALHARMAQRGDALGLTYGAPDLYDNWGYEYAAGLYLTSYESSIDPVLAQRAGHWDRHHSYERRTADRLNTHSTNAVVRRFYSSDLPAVGALYSAASARGHYLLARDEAAWNWQLHHMTQTGRYDPDHFLVAEVDDRLVAYARVVAGEPVNLFRPRDGATFSVIEAAGDHPAGVDALLGEIARVAQTFEASRIGLFVHPESTFMQHALACGGTLAHFTGAGLLRLHDLGRLLDRLGPTLDERLLNSRFTERAIHLVIGTETEQADIRLGVDAPEVVELEIPATSLLRLITGWYGIEHITTGFHERYTELLGVLFPRRDPKIGLADLL